MTEHAEDDVLSIMASDSWKSDVSEVSLDLEQEEFIVLDELDEPASEGSKMSTDDDQRVVEDHGIGQELLASSSRALSPVEEHTAPTEAAKPKSRIRTCWVCGIKTREKIRRHVLKVHLPWFWYAATACWECREQVTQRSSVAVGHSHYQPADLSPQRHNPEHKVGFTFDDETIHHWCFLVNGSLHKFVQWFECGSLEGLLEFVLSRELYKPLTSGFSSQEEQMLMFYVENYSPNMVQQLTFKPPNHVICLVNWELVASLLCRVSPDRQNMFARDFAYLTYEGREIDLPAVPPAEPFFFIDTHFHLDLVVKYLRFRNFAHLSSAMSPAGNHDLYFGVANYVFPNNWMDWTMNLGRAKTVYVSFGVHPHIASKGLTRQRETQLASLLDEYLCVAVGEIGLDYTSRCQCRPCLAPEQCKQSIRRSQEEVFVKLLLMAQARNLPVVLHCRDEGDGSAASRTLQLIAQFGCVGMRFHRHCFSGSLSELKQWQELPNVVFGLTWKSVSEASSVIPRIRPDQLVLETDAPYLSPYSCCPTNHPWNLPAIAIEVARLRNVPLSVLNSATNVNASKFYGIPKAPLSSSQRP